MCSKCGAEYMSVNQGSNIKFDSVKYKQTKTIIVNGVLSIFVNCGSQYALWYQFPRVIKYALKDLDSGNVYNSESNALSTSHDGNQIHEQYAKNFAIKWSFRLFLFH